MPAQVTVALKASSQNARFVLELVGQTKEQLRASYVLKVASQSGGSIAYCGQRTRTLRYVRLLPLANKAEDRTRKGCAA